MANFVRRIVSGNKARFKDKNLDLELDLVYVTDNIIVMGFPATGVEGFYRNRREDAKKFLDHRHGKNYWVFNFCPLRENSYPSSFFYGRVSRYPFPDHHAPPLAVLPLFVREAREWLSGSPERVAVLHCKAGKGRSGTLACAYLLSLDETPSTPKLQRSMTKKEWAKQRVDQIMETVETEGMDEEARVSEHGRVAKEKEEAASLQGASNANAQNSSERLETDQMACGKENDSNGLSSNCGKSATESLGSLSPPRGSVLGDTESEELSNARSKPNVKPFTLEDILALHTARRMKSPSSSDKKFKQGVSIPSQRRWLYYWSLLLADAAPRGFWQVSLPRVRLREIRVRMRDLGGVKMNLLKLANHLIEKTNAAKYGVQDRGKGPVWVSLARYNDELVELLEGWEKHTRSEDESIGKRGKGSEHMSSGGALQEIFTDGKWDKGKMIRSFCRLGHWNGASDTQRLEDGELNHTLRPLTDQKWEALQDEMREITKGSHPKEGTSKTLPVREPRPTDSGPSTASSITDLVQAVDEADAEKGVILDAAREVRAKIYMGQVFMGWFWFIPAFHMGPPSSSFSQEQPVSPTTTHLVLSRKEVDFPLGAGAALVDVDVTLEWVNPDLDRAAGRRDPPRTQTSEESVKAEGGEPGAGPVAWIQSAVSGATMRRVVEAREASDQ